MRERLQEFEGSILIDEQFCPELQREDDCAIMTAVILFGNLTAGQIRKINQVRKYLRVIILAELASICGKIIPVNRFNGRWRAKSSLNWPHQPPPTPEMWTLFRQVIKRVFCSKNKFARISTRRFYLINR